MPKYLLETYGCQMNLADSELLAGILGESGWAPAGQAADADLIIVNTCAVRERAAARVIGHLRSYRSLRARKPHLRIAMVGCLARYDGRALAQQLPEVDLFLGPDEYRRLPELLASAPPAPHLAIGMRREETYDDLRPRRAAGVHAWVSIMRGCDRHCAYCVVPFARGRERSLPASAVVRDVTEAVAAGCPAVTLLGQTVTSYRDGEVDFAALLERVAATPGLRRLRFLSPHPADFGDDLLRTLAAHPNIARHLHLPVQSGSDRILAAMRRGYRRADFLDLVSRARASLEGLAVTSDLIVGFPGETPEDFAATLELMEAVRFDGAFMFAYSSRPRTYAARYLADDVSDAEKRRRLEQMIALQEGHSQERYQRWVGRVAEVLVEGPARQPPGHLFGRTSDFKDTVFSAAPAATPAAGSLVRVWITAATSHTLRGEQVSATAGCAGRPRRGGDQTHGREH